MFPDICQIKLHQRCTCLYLIAILYENFKAFTVQINGIDTHMDQHGYPILGYKSDCMLGWKYKCDFAICRCDHLCLCRFYDSTITHHFLSKAFIRSRLNTACQSGHRAFNYDRFYHIPTLISSTLSCIL